MSSPEFLQVPHSSPGFPRVPLSSRAALFAGVAPSSQETAVVLLDEISDSPTGSDSLPSRLAAHGLIRFAAYTRVVAGTVRCLAGYGSPVLVAITGYSIRGEKRSHAELIELGTLLRLHILGRGWPLVEVPSGTIRKFAVGQGEVDRAMMMAALASAYRRTWSSAGEAEAYALAQIARCITCPEDYPSWRVEALGQLARSVATSSAAR